VTQNRSILDDAFMQDLVNAHHLRLQSREDRSMCLPSTVYQDLQVAFNHLEGLIATWRELRAELRQDDPMWILAGCGANMDRLIALAEEFVHERHRQPDPLV
jgi:hypothetical protein